MPIAFRKFTGHESPAPGELFVEPAAGDPRARNLAVRVCEQGLAALAQGAGPITTLVVHAEGTQPTLDEMLAAALAQRLLDGLPVDGFLPFAEYARVSRLGLRAAEMPVEKSINAMFLALRNKGGDDLTIPAIGNQFLAGWQHLFARIREAAEKDLDPFAIPLFDGRTEFAEERAYLARDRDVYQHDVRSGERWFVRFPGESQPRAGLLLREPKCVLFRDWSREDTEAPFGAGYHFLAVDWNAAGWIFSTDPAMRLSLRGLAVVLQDAEDRVDPASAGERVWFDGEPFNHTLVAPPRNNNTRLASDQILRLVCGWLQTQRLAGEVIPAQVKAPARRDSWVSRIGIAVGGFALLSASLYGFRAFAGKPPAAEPVAKWEVRDQEGVLRGLAQAEGLQGAIVTLDKKLELPPGDEELPIPIPNDYKNERRMRLTVSLHRAEAGAAVPVQGLAFAVNHEAMPDAVAFRGTEAVSAERTVVFKPHVNYVRLRVRHTSASRIPLVVRFRWQDAPETRTLRYLAVGVSTYRHHRDTDAKAKLNLRYAHSDAEAVAAALKRTGAGLFGGVEGAPVLTNKDATRNAILRALKEVCAKAAEQDLLVLMLAGHGLREREQYYFLPHDYDPEQEVESTGLSWDALRRILEECRGQVVVLLDTCHSNSAVVSNLLRREDLRHRHGIAVLAACLSDQQAHEDPRWRHGTLTLAVLEALEGKYLYKEGKLPELPQGEGGVLSLEDVYDYAKHRVRALMPGQETYCKSTDDLIQRHIPLARVR
jgi:hypothetical protein